MSGAVLDPRLHPGRTAPRRRTHLSWSDPAFRNLVWQAVIVGAVALVVWYLVSTTAQNLATRHIATGFGFLSQPAPIPIGESVLPYTPLVNTYGTALLMGVLNTFKVSAVGVVLATMLGVLIGIARLSRNFLLARLAAIYVETIRDVPVLLQLFFWYALLRALAPLHQSVHPIPGLFLSNRRMQIAWVNGSRAYWWCLLAFAAGAVLVRLLAGWAARRQDATGVRPTTWPLTLLLLAGLPLAVWWVLGAPFRFEVPVLGRFNFSGGATLSPEHVALTLGLVIYTASYIAEIVRSGVQALARGQWEAAGALGLHGMVLRHIVLPHALRVISRR